MKITKNKLSLNVPSNKYVPSIIDEIRENLQRMKVNGLTIDIRYDVRSNVAMARFNFNSKDYEMKVTNQKDIRANLWAINKRIEYKARMHLLGIEPFELSVSPYLAIENKSETQQQTDMPKATARAYAVFGIAEYSSNDNIKKKYKELVRAFHPDMALSEEAKAEFIKKFQEIQEAYSEIKKERGFE